MNSKFIIYALVDPFTKEVRYVGKSCSGLKRPKNHNKPSELKYDTHKVHWIKSLIDKNSKPEIVILQEFNTGIQLDIAEQYWINHYKILGAKLTNSSDGGTGSLGRTVKEDTIKKMSIKRKEWNNKIKEERGFITLASGMKLRKLHMFENGVELKQCTNLECNKWLKLNEFYICKGLWDGLQSKCKKCDNKIRSENRRNSRNPSLEIEKSFNKWLSTKQNKTNKTIGLFLFNKEKQIKDVNIWEHEWINRRKQVENFLISAMGLGTSIGARECEFKEISLKDAKSFCEENHIQGYSHITNYAIGGYYNNELVALATFSPHHRNSSEITLNRFCCKYGIHVSGALSKTTKMGLQYFNQPIFTWVHKTLSNGDSYVKSGWEIIDHLRPDYFYIDKNRRVISKQSRQKRIVGTSKEMTESDHAKIDGLNKIYDLGKIKLKFDISTK